jgi:diguanylate cyclase (GGDEF)-like protein
MSSKLVSVKQSLNEIENAERLFRTALNCYVSAVDSIDRHVLPLQPALEPEYRHRLKAIREAIADPSNLEQTRARLDKVLAAYCSQTVELLNERAEDIRQILLALATATEAMDKQSGGYGEQFRQIATQMENVTHLVDLGEIRREITGQVAALTSVANRMYEDSEATIAKLQGEMSGVQRRLDEAERLAETDPLTGILNRRGMERRVEALIQNRREFCVMLLDLNRFKGINDRYGHLCGDEILLAFSRRLAAEIRTSDSVCRWGGDEFLATLCCPYREAVERSQQIAKKVCGRYTVQKNLHLEVSASVGLSQHKTGQTSKDVFAVADSLLYVNKAR